MTYDDAARDVMDEIVRARRMHGEYSSPHEGWAVILEEVDEIWEEVKKNQGRGKSAYDEAKQIACTAIRYMCEVATRK